MSYHIDNNFEVKTSACHKRRGYCCQSNCLHCPFGYTLKNLGLKFREMTAQDLQLFPKIDIAESDYNQYRIMTLKDRVAGLIRPGKLFLEEWHYAPFFEDQGLSKEIIESYYYY
jgi:hypothetical protein